MTGQTPTPSRLNLELVLVFQEPGRGARKRAAVGGAVSNPGEAAPTRLPAAHARPGGGSPSLDTQSTNATSSLGLRCSNPAGYLRVRCSHGSEVWVPRRCRRCDECVTLHRLGVVARIRAGIESDPTGAALLTVTSLKGTTPEELMKAWNRFRLWLRRQAPSVQYAAVKERGAGGMWHLHVVLLGWPYVPQAKIAAAWRKASGGAYVVDIRRIDHAGKAASYVAKQVAGYLTKALRGDVKKRVTYSRGFPKEAEGPEKWELVGEEWPHKFPPPSAGSVVLPGGGVVVLSRGCECVARAAPASYDQHRRWWALMAGRSAYRDGVVE